MKDYAFTLLLALAGCAARQTEIEVPSPYERYLPQVPPSETNRIYFPAGYSIVSPIGWTTQTIPIADWFKSSVADQVMIEGHESDQYPPRINIQHMGPDEYALYHGMLQPTYALSNGLKRIQFQSEPALSYFLPGYGSRQAVRGSYQPWLTQSIFFEREGNGFILTFDMRNADKNRPYYTRPVTIIEQYFETFRYTNSDK